MNESQSVETANRFTLSPDLRSFTKMGISNPRDWVQSGLGKVSKSEKKNMNVVVYLVNLGVTAYMLRIVNVGGVM